MIKEVIAYPNIFFIFFLNSSIKRGHNDLYPNTVYSSFVINSFDGMKFLYLEQRPIIILAKISGPSSHVSSPAYIK